MTHVAPHPIPRQGGRSAPLDELERTVARTADLVLKLAALADRYERGGTSGERVQRLRVTVERGRRSLAELAGAARVPR